LRVCAAGVEPHAAEEMAVGDASRGEEAIVALDQIVLGEHAVEVEAHHLDPRTNAVLVVRFLDGVGVPAPASYVFNFGARSTLFTIDDTAADVWGVFRLHFSFLAGTTQPSVTGRLLAARRDARAALCTAA